MIVEKIRVRNWRHLRDEHEFELGDRMNLLVGSNEAGKSTLFEVLQRTLFDRHNGRAQEIRAIQPIQSSLGPEATVILRSDDQRFRVRKRFLDDAFSDFSVERDGEWEREHEADRADEEARKLVEGDVPGKGATKVKHRGVAQALWYLQREAGLPDSEWNQAVQQGLEGLVEVVTSSPAEQRILDRIGDAYDENWTPKTAELSSNSQVRELEETIGELEAELDEKRNRLEQAETRRAELEELFADRDRKQEVLDEAKGRASTLKERVEEGKELLRAKEEAQREVEKARREVRESQGDLDRLEELDENIEELESDLEEARNEEGEYRHRAEVAKRAVQEARERRRDELEPRRNDLRRQIEGLRALRDLRRLEDEVEALETALDELSARRESLRDLPAPSEEEMEDYREARQQLSVLHGKAEASAIHVAFDLEPEILVDADPAPEQSDEQDDEFLVTRPTKFSLGDLGTVSVRGGGEDLRELREQIDALEEELDEVESRYDASDQDELNEKFERRQALEDQIDDLEDRIADLVDDVSEPEDRLRELEEELDEKRSKAEKLSEDQRQLSGAALEGKMATLQDELEGLDEEIDSLQENEEKAEAERDELQEKVEEASGKASSLQGTLSAKRDQKAEVLEEYGTRKQLEEVHRERNETLEEREQRLQKIEGEYQAEVGDAEKELERVESEITNLEEQIRELDQDISEVRGALQTIAEEDVYAEAGNLEAELESKRRRLDTLRTRAEGTKLLKQLLDDLQKERTEHLVGPVSERVDRWIEVLTDGRYVGVRFDDALRPEAVRTARYEEFLDLEQLSFGTREQVIVLFRLAVGDVLGEDERRLVILDDGLVNSDPVRTRRLCEILEDASDRCQILLATCDDSRYGSLDARRIRVPQDGIDARA